VDNLNHLLRHTNRVFSGIVNLVYRKLTIADLVGCAAWCLEVRFRNLIGAWMLVHCACCVTFVWTSARADHPYMGVLQGVCNCVLYRNL